MPVVASRTRWWSCAFTDTVAETVFDHFGCWRWQPYADPNPRFAERDGWYATRAAGHEVLPPLEAAA